MRALLPLVPLVGLVAGCATRPATAEAPYLPPGVYGTYLDNDTGAINQAAWAFASPANTRGNPVDAAKAVVALEYLPGELRDNPRWVKIDAAIPLRMAQARNEVQQILGIAPAAPRQAIVNALLAVAWDLQFDNQAAALSVLRAPVFTLPPERTLAILSDLPYVQQANLSTLRAQNEAEQPGTLG
jgi:hypothetical protein